MALKGNKTEAKGIAEALLKKAMGYSVDEVVSEYVSEEESGEIKLVKKKITTKHIPPDSAATKTLLDFFYAESAIGYKQMTDIELQQEKQRLLKMLNENEKQSTKK